MDARDGCDPRRAYLRRIATVSAVIWFELPLNLHAETVILQLQAGADQVLFFKDEHGNCRIDILLHFQFLLFNQQQQSEPRRKPRYRIH